ncbi:MAG: hydroxyethylthiazole kinase [Acholeplasmatales bacterium]|nr:hydroxyethylthiazole kinase [Acholeplasmatales bacterium]
MEFIKNIREKTPLIHFITNYVTVNDVANAALAIGASPIMTDEVNDAPDMQNICNALVINPGTLNENTVKAMIESGKRANKLGHVVVLDPCGAGATPYRNKVIAELMANVKFDCIKGNISEIKALANVSQSTKGVDADVSDNVTRENMFDVFKMAKELSQKTGAIIAITGPIDVIASDKAAYITDNGCKEMRAITGTGCMTAGVIAASLVANPSDKLKACVAGVIAVGISGERALSYAKGTGSLHIGLIDELSNLDDIKLEVGAKIERFDI